MELDEDREQQYDLLTAALIGAAVGAGVTLLLRRGPSGRRPVGPLVRYAGRGWRLNSQVPSAILAREWALPDAGAARLEREVLDGHLSRRGAVRVHRLAWTVADLFGRDRPSVSDVDTAFRLRQGEPLLRDAVARRAS